MNNHEYLVDNEDKSLANNRTAGEYTTDCFSQQDDSTKNCSYRECDTCGNRRASRAGRLILQTFVRLLVKNGVVFLWNVGWTGFPRSKVE